MTTQNSPTLSPTEITLTDEQSQAISLISSFYADPNRMEFRLGGYAGTGKTTIIKFILTPKQPTDPVLGLNYSMPNIRANVCAFTGKACHVLRKKGIHSAQTIHSMIYDCYEEPKGVMNYDLKTRLDASPNLIIIDEASMLSTELYEHLKSFRVKLLFIGDPGQLEPIGDNPNLMCKTDFTLTHIHRQAALSPIISLASAVRQGFGVKTQSPSGDVLIKSKFVTDSELASVSQIICAKNATRSLLNRRVRVALGREQEPLVQGEKLICLRNSRKQGLFNGLIAYVEDYTDHEAYWKCLLKDEVGKEYHDILVWKKPFFTQLEKMEIPPRDMMHFDYGYAITCHKSQGSEWEHVLVYDEVLFKTDMKRWRYTAITRASNKLTYCI